MTQASANLRGSNEFERMVALLESSDEYRVLRRLRPLPRFEGSPLDGSLRLGMFVDVETTGLDPLTAELVGIAVCWKEGEAYYLPVRSPEGEDHLDAGQTPGHAHGRVETKRTFRRKSGAS